DGDDAGRGINGERTVGYGSAAAGDEAVGDGVLGAICVTGEGCDEIGRASCRERRKTVGGGIAVGWGGDGEVVQIGGANGEALGRRRSIGVGRNDIDGLGGGGVVSGVGSIGDGDDAGRGINGERTVGYGSAAAGDEAVGDGVLGAICVTGEGCD